MHGRPARRPRHWGRTVSTTSAPAKYVDWLTIDDNAQSVTDDVSRIRTQPLVPSNIPIYGYIYDVSSGRLIDVPEASKVGQAA